MPATRLKGANVSRREPFGPFCHIELYLLLFAQRTVALGDNRALVYEHVRALILG